MQEHLPKELQELVQELIDSGTYHAFEEIVEDALWLLRDRHLLYKVKLAEMRKLIAVGIEQADRGELVEGELVFQRIMDKVQKRLGESS